MKMIKLKKPRKVSRTTKSQKGSSSSIEKAKREKRKIERQQLEQIIETNKSLPVSFLEQGIKRAQAVAFIYFPSVNGKEEDGGASGFLIGHDLLLTNNHVLENKDQAKTAKIMFTFQHNGDIEPLIVDEYICDPDNFFYTNSDLDYTVVKIKKDTKNKNKGNGNQDSNDNQDGNSNQNGNDNGDSKSRGSHTNIVITSPSEKWGTIPLIEKTEIPIGKRVNLIQHSQMQRKEIACHRNLVQEIEENKILYTTDTEPASSGSPIFNDKWQLIALHHSVGHETSGEWLSNEGILIPYIINDLVTNLKSDDNNGREILFELQIYGIEKCSVRSDPNEGRDRGSGSESSSDGNSSDNRKQDSRGDSNDSREGESDDIRIICEF